MNRAGIFCLWTLSALFWAVPSGGAEKLPDGLLAGLYTGVIAGMDQPKAGKPPEQATINAIRTQVGVCFIYWVNAVNEPKVHERFPHVEKTIAISLWAYRDHLDAFCEDPMTVLNRAIWGDLPDDTVLRKRANWGFNQMASEKTPVFASVANYSKASAEFRKWVSSLLAEAEEAAKKKKR